MNATTVKDVLQLLEPDRLMQCGQHKLLL